MAMATWQVKFWARGMRPLIWLSVFAAAWSGSRLAAQPPVPARPQSSNVHARDSLQNSRIVFAQQGQATVAFLGGSITEMEGYRPMVCESLQQRFPQTKFRFVSAGLSSTCSTTGAFRLERDVLSAKPDLLFVEFAVNDDQDAGHAARECRRGMEGILRKALIANPQMDIVVTHFVNPPMLEQLTRGETPISSASHEAVAEHYGVSSIDLARELAERIAAGSFTWERFGGTHPGEPGNRLAADLVDDLLDTAWEQPLPASATLTPHALPAALDENSYFRGRFVSPGQATTDSQWTLDRPDWKQIPGSFRSNFAGAEVLHAAQAGAELSLRFEGTAIGAFVLAGPDAGMVEATIDGASPVVIDLFHAFSKGLHYPRTVMFATDLSPGEHRLVLKVHAAHNDQSSGHAVRILQFVAN